jgi:hypothetical protein
LGKKFVFSRHQFSVINETCHQLKIKIIS